MSWVHAINGSLRAYKLAVATEDGETPDGDTGDGDVEIRDSLVMASCDNDVWSDGEEETPPSHPHNTLPASPVAPTPAAPTQSIPVAARPTLQHQKSVPNSDSEDMRRLKMKWQKSLILERSELASLQSTVKTLEAKHLQLNDKLKEKEKEFDETAADLKEYYDLQLSQKSTTVPPSLTGSTLQTLASLITSNTFTFTDDPAQRTTRGTAARTIASALTPAQRKALQSALTQIEDSQTSQVITSSPPPPGLGQRRGVSFSLGGDDVLGSLDNNGMGILDNGMLDIIGTPALPSRPYSEPTRPIERPTFLNKSVSESSVVLGNLATLPKAVARTVRRSNPEMSQATTPLPALPEQPTFEGVGNFINSDVMRSVNGTEEACGLSEPVEYDDDAGPAEAGATDSEVERELLDEPSLIVYYFYLRHNETKVYLIPQILKDYKGEEDSLLGSLLEKYKLGRTELLDIARDILENVEESEKRRRHLKNMVLGTERKEAAKKTEEANIVWSGWLEKKNRHGRRKFSKRYFRLLGRDGEVNSPVLAYFSSEPANDLAKPKGVILLDGCNVFPGLAKESGDKTTYTFEVRHPTRETRMFKYSVNKSDGGEDKVVEMIAECMKKYNKECQDEEIKDPRAAEERRNSISLAESNMRSESDEEK